jgi:hypothetical protein
MMEPAELARSGDLMTWHQRHTESVFRAVGELSGGSREFAFPVDSEIDSLAVSISVQCKGAVAILEPSGSDAVGDRIEYRAGRAMRIVHPAPGVWKVRVTGRGVFFVTAEAISPVSLDQPKFVAPGVRPGESALATKPTPALGSEAMLAVRVSGARQAVKLGVVNPTGDLLETLDAESTSERGDYLARLRLRHAAFRVAVAGLDSHGWPFQRLHPAMVQPLP